MGNLINTDKSINVYHNREVDIDGFLVRDGVLEVVNSYKIKQKFDHLFEPFCGHGAIGFNLLENNIASKLTLLDIYPPAIECCNQTITANNLANVCQAICTSTFSFLKNDIPEKFDLVVGNPPWREGVTDDVDLVNHVEHQLRKKVDQDWNTHRNFFAHINEITTDDVEMFIYEDARFTTPDTFADMYQGAGFKLINVINEFGPYKTGFIMHLVKE